MTFKGGRGEEGLGGSGSSRGRSILRYFQRTAVTEPSTKMGSRIKPNRIVQNTGEDSCAAAQVGQAAANWGTRRTKSALSKAQRVIGLRFNLTLLRPKDRPTPARDCHKSPEKGKRLCLERSREVGIIRGLQVTEGELSL